MPKMEIYALQSLQEHSEVVLSDFVLKVFIVAKMFDVGGY